MSTRHERSRLRVLFRSDTGCHIDVLKKKIKTAFAFQYRVSRMERLVSTGTREIKTLQYRMCHAD